MTELAPQSKSGGYVRESYSNPNADMMTDLDRYHLYIGNPCPWCHRVDIAAKLRGLQDKHLTITYLVLLSIVSYCLLRCLQVDDNTDL